VKVKVFKTKQALTIFFMHFHYASCLFNESEPPPCVVLVSCACGLDRRLRSPPSPGARTKRIIFISLSVCSPASPRRRNGTCTARRAEQPRSQPPAGSDSSALLGRAGNRRCRETRGACRLPNSIVTARRPQQRRDPTQCMHKHCPALCRAPLPTALTLPGELQYQYLRD
jgi:hypothetical protein